MPENSPNQPMVSIVVPVYKAERFLDECIRSIVGQTYSNLEIILVDDASPDQCPRICDEWAERDERVSVIHLDNGKGASGARNVGLDHCTGDYVMFVDSDDLLKTDAVRYSVKQVLVGDYDLVIFGKHYIDEYGNVSRTNVIDHDMAAIADESDYYTTLSYLLRADYLNPPWGKLFAHRLVAGMRGLVANPKGEIIPRPVKSNYRDGLSVLEYFISQHGARKGLADTALRTAESGYLTRRLVDVSQDVIVREEDCGTKAGLPIRVAERDNDGNLVLVKAADGGPYSRLLAADVIDPADGQTVLYKRDDALSMDVLNDLVAHGVEEVKCRSVLTCESKRGVCAKCYGWSLATNKLVDVGETVGIVAAQSIGEPGTQLTLRSFHSGGVAAASDITQGLPRVTELFEARTPKGEAPITEFAGSIKIVENDRGRQIILTPDADSGAPKEDGVIKPITYQVSKRVPLKVADGDHIKVGTQLVEGSVDPKKILTILGKRAAQVNIVEEVHTVYRSQGVDIHDKHIEVIVHQMTRRVTIIDSGDTDLLPGELVDNARFREINRNIVKNGGRPAVGRPALMGITKASLATDSWLSAASFQETTRVLTEAALSEKVDDLKGLKENVIIGKLIPAGTGLARYRNAVVEPDKAIRDTIYPNFGLGGDGDLGDASFSDADLSDLNFSNLEFGDLKLGDDFNPDDFYSDQGGQPDIEE